MTSVTSYSSRPMPKILYFIPARGGSKGIPGKNIKELNGKPLIYYTIDAAREVAADEDICVSTDSREIADVVRQRGLDVPFIRPDYLSTDTASTDDACRHALRFFADQGKQYDLLVILQPTSPFRKSRHIREAIDHFEPGLDMVVSVTEATSNPYFVMFKEDGEGYLQQLMQASYTRRQDCPRVWEYNGAVYVVNVESIMSMATGSFKRKKKYVMDVDSSIDLDTPRDWMMAEILLKNII